MVTLILLNNKHLLTNKATGLGISEFMLRFMAWLCLEHDNELSGSQMCIVTGPRIDLAIALIDRMKRLFASSKGIATAFDTKETVIELNNVKIEAFHHII
jgi:late competence protein required for DNA uptake (superfamily II DNA/RNA helicase)